MLINLVSLKLGIVFHYKIASQASEETSHIQEKTFSHLYLTRDTSTKHQVIQINLKNVFKQAKESNQHFVFTKTTSK